MPLDYDKLHPKKQKKKNIAIITSNEECNIKNCVGCNHPIEKTGGCNFIKCKICKTEWCWICHREKKIECNEQSHNSH